MENRGFKIAFRIFYFIHLPNKEDYQPVQDRSRCKQIPQAIACPGIGENA